MTPTIDLTTPGFWLVMLLALALMTPITHGVLRRWVWAGVNLLFIAWMLKLRCLEVAAGLAVVHLALRLLACGRWRAPVAAAGLAVAPGSVSNQTRTPHPDPTLKPQPGPLRNAHHRR